MLLIVGPLFAACRTGRAVRGRDAPTPPTSVTIAYSATLRPDVQAVTVEGLVAGVRAEDVLGWARPPHDYERSSPAPDTVWATPAGVRFRVVARLRDTAAAEKRSVNAPDPIFDSARLVTWGYSLFPTPVLRRPPARVVVDVAAPGGWAVVTSAGGRGGHFEVGSLTALRGTALFAGAVRDTAFQAAGVPVVLAARRDDPIPDSAYARIVGRLLAAGRAYFGGVTSARVGIVVDRLGGARTYAPGMNLSGPEQSATILVRGDVARADTVDFVGPLAHELAHTWIPYAFGDEAATTRELGAFFGEGFTNYAGYTTAHAAGLLDDAAFARALSRYVLEYQYVSGPGRAKNAGALPYSHGMLAAWALDLALLRATGGRRGLDDVLRRLVRAQQARARTAPDSGLTRAALVAALAEAGGPEVGALYGVVADTTRPFALAPLLAGTGIRLDSVPDLRQALRAAYAGAPPAVVRFAPTTAAETAFVKRFLGGAVDHASAAGGGQLDPGRQAPADPEALAALAAAIRDALTGDLTDGGRVVGSGRS